MGGEVKTINQAREADGFMHFKTRLDQKGSTHVMHTP